MRMIGLSATVAALIAAVQASAQGAGSDLRLQRDGTLVMMRHSTTPIALTMDETPLDGPHPFTCRSASGCAVIMSSSVKVTGNIVYACGYIDGSLAGAPGCWYGTDTIANIQVGVARQQIFVSQGHHTVETRVYTSDPVGQIDGWAVDYTVYDRN